MYDEEYGGSRSRKPSRGGSGARRASCWKRIRRNWKLILGLVGFVCLGVGLFLLLGAKMSGLVPAALTFTGGIILLCLCCFWFYHRDDD